MTRFTPTRLRPFRLLSVALALLLAGALAACDQMPTASESSTPQSPEAQSSAAGPGLSTASPGTPIIVSLKESAAPGSHPANQKRAAEIARKFGIEPTHTYGTALFGFAGAVPKGGIKALRQSDLVRMVTRDQKASIPPRPGTTAPPGSCSPWPDCKDGGGGGSSQTVPWGVDRIGAGPGETEIGDGNDGAGVHVYIIDTGIDSNHGDLNDNLGNGKAIQECKGNPNLCVKPWDDDNGHGTHVAGTVGAEDNSQAVVGVADRVTLHAVKVLDKNGSGSLSDIIAGIDWVASETKELGRPTVANMSLGASRNEGDSCGSSNFHLAVCDARDVGVVFAVAAGNDGADAEGFVPASYDNAVITQSATSSDGDADAGDDDWPDWSNWGNNSADWDNDSDQHAPVALAAPGVDILSTWKGGGTNTISGTSMASPHVAGAAALAIKEYDITATNAFQNVRSNLLRIDESTDDWSNSSGNSHEEDFVDVRN